MKSIKEQYPDSSFGTKVIQVIQSKASRGNGSEQNPNRIVTLYHSLNGELLAVYDPLVNG